MLTAEPEVLRRPPVPESEARPRGRRHSRARDRAAVRHHYDVSNDFYRGLLGPSLVYSCAYFDSPDDTLEAAQERKLELVCRKLRLAEGERLLDIGCGWGSLLIHAARHHGVQAVGITLSEEQAALARRRVREAGLGDLVEVRVADYRDIADGPYDKIASVGMVEHVGAAQLGAYAATIARLLRPGGLVLNHGIARLFSEPSGDKSLIQRYVFPDGELPPIADVVGAFQAAGLEARDVESLREHYVLTLRRGWGTSRPTARRWPPTPARSGPASGSSTWRARRSRSRTPTSASSRSSRPAPARRTASRCSATLARERRRRDRALSAPAVRRGAPRPRRARSPSGRR